jgi:hypothetical protein
LVRPEDVWSQMPTVRASIRARTTGIRTSRNAAHAKMEERSEHDKPQWECFSRFAVAPRLGSTCHHAEWSGAADVRKATYDAIKLANTKGQQFVSAFQATIKAVWKSINSIVQHVDIPLVVGCAPPSVESRLCYNAGMCLCGTVGKNTKSIVANIDSAVKRVCPAKSVQRATLKDARIVAVFIGGLPDREEEGAVSAGASASSPLQQPRFQWTLISDVCLSPFELRYYGMELRSDAGLSTPIQRCIGDSCRIDYEGIVQLKATFASYNHWEFASKLDQKLKWEVAFCAVLFEERLVGDLTPDGCEVSFIDGQLHLVWDPSKRRKFTPTAVNAEWASMLADMDEKMGVDEEELPAREEDGDADDASECRLSLGGLSVDSLEERLFGPSDDSAAEDDGRVLDGGGDGETDIPTIVVDVEPAFAGALIAPASSSAAASSGDALELIPMLPGAPKPKAADRIERCAVPGYGYIFWYRSTKEFYAFCYDGAHIRLASDADYKDPTNDKPRFCRKTRTSIAGKRQGSGKPLGFLTAWLLAQGFQTCSYDHVHFTFPTLAERQAARALLRTVAGSAAVFAEEQPSTDPDLEPDVFDV